MDREVSEWLERARLGSVDKLGKGFMAKEEAQL